MPRWLVWLYVLTGLPPFAWMLWMIYLQLFYGLPDKAGIAAMMGVMVGFVPFCGLQFAKLIWSHRKGIELPGLVLSACFLLLTGLIAIMRVTGDFGERVYGGFVPLWEVGFVLAVPFGLVMAVGLWYAEREA